MKKEKKSIITVPVFLSILAVLVSLAGLIYQFCSKENDYLAFAALLVSNITLLVANLTNNNGKKDQ